MGVKNTGLDAAFHSCVPIIAVCSIQDTICAEVVMGDVTEAVACRAERNGSGSGFVTGFVVGGAIFGALGFLFAPQISAALLSEDQRLKLPKFLDEEEKDPEATKQACSGRDLHIYISGILCF